MAWAALTLSAIEVGLLLPFRSEDFGTGGPINTYLTSVAPSGAVYSARQYQRALMRALYHHADMFAVVVLGVHYARRQVMFSLERPGHARWTPPTPLLE